MFILIFLLFFTYGDIEVSENKIKDIFINFEMNIYNYFNNNFKQDLTEKILELREKIEKAYHFNSRKKPLPIIINIDLNYYGNLPIIIKQEEYFITIPPYEQKVLSQQNIFTIKDFNLNINDEYLNQNFLQFICPVFSFIINILNDNSFILYKRQQEFFFNIKDEKETLSEILLKIYKKQNSLLTFNSINKFLSKKNNHHYLFINDQDNYFNPFHEIIIQSNIDFQTGQAPELENPPHARVSMEIEYDSSAPRPDQEFNSPILIPEQPEVSQPSRPNQAEEEASFKNS